MAKFEWDHPLRGRQMQVGWVKTGHFRRKTCYSSKTIQDRRIVSYALYQMAPFPITLGDPTNPQNTPIFAFFVAFHIFVVSQHRDFIFVYRLIVASPSRRTTNRP